MPVRIPFYEQQLTPQGRLAGEARGQVYSGAVGQAMQRAGNVIADVGLMIDKEVSEGQAREADNMVSAEIRDLLYDPENGYFAQVGKGAIDGYTSTEAQIKAVADKYSQNLTPRAKQMYSEVVRRRIDGALSGVSAHAMNQAKVYNKSQAEARRDMAVLDAISLAGGDQNLFNQAKSTAIQEAGYGLDEATKTLATANTLTVMHKSVIDKFLSQPGGSQQARDWYAANFNEIAPDARNEIVSALNSGNVRDQSLELSFSLQSQYKTLKEQEAALKSQYQANTIDAEIYDATRQRIRQDAAIREEQSAINKNAVLGLAQDWVVNNPDVSIADMPTQLYNQMVAQGKLGSLINLQSTVRGTKEQQSDPESYVRLYALASREPKKFQEEWSKSSATYRETLSDTEYKNLGEIWGKIANNDLKGMDAVKIADDRLAKLDDTLRAVGLDPLAKKERGAKRLAELRANYIFAIEEFISRETRPPTNKEAENLAYELLRKVSVPALFGTKEVLAFEAGPEAEPFMEAETFLENRSRQELSALGVSFNRDGSVIKNDAWLRAVNRVQEAREAGELNF